MPTFEQYDVVTVPFPYTDRAIFERRPALVISRRTLEEDFGLLWVAMITAAENKAWNADVALPDHQAAGLPIASVIRPTKIATIDASRAIFRGKIPADTAARVAAFLASIIV